MKYDYLISINALLESLNAEGIGFDTEFDRGIHRGLVIADMMAKQLPAVVDYEPIDWIPVEERLPPNFVSVLGYMTDAGDFPPVRECFTVGNAFFFPALRGFHPVSHWAEIPSPPLRQRQEKQK